MKNLYKFIFIIILIIVVILIRKYILIKNNKDTIANNEIGNNAVENQEANKDEIVKIEDDINSSNYKKADYNLSYYQRKDMGVKKIIDKNESAIYDFDIYTVGGDVNITIDGDMVYDFKKSLEENIITIDEILNQAKEDTKYGICEEGYYQDGGTTEYMYEEYTLIKYNTLDGNTDFVVAPKGDVRNQVDKILYK